LDWEIAPLDGIDWNSELQKQAEICKVCFDHPNESDDFESMIEQVLEDYLIGAGAVETQVSGDPQRPLFMWPTDGLSIQIYPQWSGKPNEPRYAQTMGYGSEYGGGEIASLRDDELMYLRPNPNTSTPFGFGPLEIAFNAISRLLQVAEFAGLVAGNARPSTGLDMPGLTAPEMEAIRNFWRNDVEGQGFMPIFSSSVTPDGKPTGMQVLRFYPEGDNALFLKYQDFLIRELGAAFDLSPQNFGLERDVNRNTSEVAEDRDWDQAIKPTAHSIAKNFTRHCIQGRLGFSQLQFRFVGLDREDEEATARIQDIRYKNNSLTPNEIRDRFGEVPMDSEWADLTSADVEIAKLAARGMATMEDKDLPKAKPAKQKKQAAPPKNSDTKGF
jgi:hypothetical protein